MGRLVFVAVLLLGGVNAAGQALSTVGPGTVLDDSFNPKLDEYVVEQGDTLWDISERVVGDPFLWPRVWALNPEITNPHWIYPGNVIRFYEPDVPLPNSADLVADSRPIPQEPEVDPDPSSEDPDPIETVNTADLIEPVRRQSTQFVGMVVTPKELKEAGKITNAVQDKILLSTLDEIFITYPKDSVPPVGSRHISFRTASRIAHPITGEDSGYVTRITGIVRVLGAEEEVVRAEVEYSSVELERGQFVTPLVQDPRVPLDRYPAQTDIEGVLLAIGEESLQVAGRYQTVFVDRGEKDGLKVGNVLNVFIRGDEVTNTVEGLPYSHVGELLVVDTKSTAATCLVVGSRRELEPGLPVRTLRGSRRVR